MHQTEWLGGFQFTFGTEVDGFGVTPPSMLKTPSGVHPCSSSPINARLGSLLNVVFPVPERPKKTATSPSVLWLEEQCMGNTSCSTGRMKFYDGEHPLLISPV